MRSTPLHIDKHLASCFVLVACITVHQQLLTQHAIAHAHARRKRNAFLNATPLRNIEKLGWGPGN